MTVTKVTGIVVEARGFCSTPIIVLMAISIGSYDHSPNLDQPLNYPNPSGRNFSTSDSLGIQMPLI